MEMLLFILYLDDITKEEGKFINVCGPNFYPGEDITVNVAPAEKTKVNSWPYKYEAKYDEENAIITNSIFGSLKPAQNSTDPHNDRKIEAVKDYISKEQINESKGIGLISRGLILMDNGEDYYCYYAQIDNSRHLQNLSTEVSYWSNPFLNQTQGAIKTKIQGAIQTDNIYWSGEIQKAIQTDNIYWSGDPNEYAYTDSITNELGPDFSIRRGSSRDILATDSCFSPIFQNNDLKCYDGRNFKISGLKVNASENAGLFSFTKNEMTIKNLSIENENIISTNGNAGGIIGYPIKPVTFDNVKFKGNLKIEGKQSAGGFIGHVTNSDSIKFSNSSIEIEKGKGKGEITSSEGYAGGLMGDSWGVTIGISDKDNKDNEDNKDKNKGVLIKNIKINGAKSAGGLIGHAVNTIQINDVDIDTVDIKSTSNNINDGRVGGVIGEAQNGSLNISDVNLKNLHDIRGKGATGGLIGFANQMATTINNASITGGTIVSTGADAGGFIGYGSGYDNNITIGNSTIRDGSVTSADNAGNAGGIIGVSNAPVNLNGITTDSLCIAGNEDAGGLIAKTTERPVEVSYAKVIGKNAAIFAKQNAGGLIGNCSSKLEVENAAASVFVESSERNAGGLIGIIITGNTDQSRIEQSYYGGRTVSGAYGTCTFNAGTENKREYEANISGGLNAGGLIGFIGDNQYLTISKCFSTGSVKTSSGSAAAGGFIGFVGILNPYNSNLNLEDCYSMGKVLNDPNASDATQRIGGFIGRISGTEPNCTRVFYLNAFNLSSIQAIGNSENGTIGNSENSKIKEISNANEILGNAESSDLTSVTTNYDETLNGQAYPYKNWTKSGGGVNDPIAYYGDWPLPNKQLNGRLVYYHRLRGNKNGGEFTLTGYDTSLTTTLSNQKGNLEADGFGIICEAYSQTPNRKDAHQKFGYSNAVNGEYTLLNAEGNNNDDDVECSEFFLEGKKYYFFRLTTIKFKDLKDSTTIIYFKGGENTIYANIIYKATINKEADTDTDTYTYTVTFDRVE